MLAYDELLRLPFPGRCEVVAYAMISGRAVRFGAQCE